jgi:trans-aconitate methyltransferase
MDLIELKNRTSPVNYRHPWELARLFALNYFLQDYFKPGSPQWILDIGCGDTFVIENLAKRHPTFSFIAIDTAFTEDYIVLQKTRLNNSKIYLFNNLQDAKKELDIKADIVLLMDVIEHVEDDSLLIETIVKSAYITNESVFFITVPAYNKLFCTHDVFLGHFRRYNNVNLIKLIERNNLKQIKSGYFFFTLLFPRFVQVLKEKYWKDSNASTGLTSWNGGSAISETLKVYLICDLLISDFLKKIGIKLPGLSNYLLCKKSV